MGLQGLPSGVRCPIAAAMRCSSTVPSKQIGVSMQDNNMGSMGDDLPDNGRSPKDGPRPSPGWAATLATALTVLATVEAYGYMFLAW